VNQMFFYIDIRKYSKDKRIHFFINISIGIFIAVLCHFLEATSLGEDMINMALDIFIRRETMISLKAADNPKEKDLIFIDIDNKTYKSWNEPFITPRDKLADLINAAYRGGAKVILVDILLEKKDLCRIRNDEKLKSIFETIKKERSPTTVILAARLRKNGTLVMPMFVDGITDDGVSLETFEDRTVSYPNVRVATPCSSATSTDQILRYWDSNEELNRARRIRLLNMAELAASLIRDSKKVAEKSKQDEPDYIYKNRIRFFLIPPGVIEKAPKGNLGSSMISASSVNGIIPCKDKIVIIGNSYDDSGDIYRTPVGEMSGMYILGNALNTIYLGKQPAHPSRAINILIEIFAIIIAAYVFLKFPSLLAQIISSAILIFTLGILSVFYFYHTGVFLNFVFSVAGMGFHRTFSNIEDIFRKRGHETKHFLKEDEQ
jgi:hypothetical protein